MRLSNRMCETLAAAKREPLRRIFDQRTGSAPWPAPWQSLHALERQGLLQCSERRNKRGYRFTEWTITDAGVMALDPPPRHRPDRSRFMSRSGYTTNPQKSIDRDAALGAGRGFGPVANKMVAVEVVELDDLARFARAAREREMKRRRHNGTLLDAQQLEERLGNVRCAARDRRMDISSEERLVRHMMGSDRERHALQRLVRLERQLGQRAA